MEQIDKQIEELKESIFNKPVSKEYIKEIQTKINKIVEKREEQRYNNGFFSILGYYLITFGKDWLSKNTDFILNAIRDCGKSFSVWNELIIPILWETLHWKIAYVRTNQAKLKAFREEFNSKYRGRYYMSQTHIYKVADYGNGKLNERSEEIGIIIGVMNEENIKSLSFENYHFVFWEEYNEINTYIGLYDKWITLLTTIQRKNKPFHTLLIGNKNNGNSDIMNRAGIVPSEINEQSNYGQDDVIIEIDKDFMFVDVAMETFAHLFDKNANNSKWARLDKRTDDYLNKGIYLCNDDNNVVVYHKTIEPSCKVIKYFTYENYILEFGTFGNDKDVYFHCINEIKNPSLQVISLDMLGYLKNKKASSYDTFEDYQDFANLIKKKIKHEKIYYSSFDAKNIIEKYVLQCIDLFYN